MTSTKPNINVLRQIINPRLLAVILLGFAAGLPLALTGSTLQAWFTQTNVNIVTIGTLSLLGIPYALKFIWAPLMDHFSLPWLGKRKGWIALTQIGLVLTIIYIALLDPASQSMQIGMIALLLAFFAASQDIAIDAYRTDILQVDERGLGAAYYIFAYRVAALISGGLALVCADYFGWKVTYEMMAGLMLLVMIFSYSTPRVNEASAAASNIFLTTIEAIQDILSRDKVILLLLFVMFYKLGDAFALSLITNFLLHGLGFSLTEIGLVFKTVSFIATILGGFVGGILLLRWNIYYALLIFAIMQAFSNLTFAILAIIGKNFVFMAFALFIENFCSGLSTAAFLAFLMSLCNRRFTASQFALFSAIASIGRVFLGPMAALMVTNLGWVQFYIWSFVLCFPGIFILVLLKEKVLHHAHVTAD